MWYKSEISCFKAGMHNIRPEIQMWPAKAFNLFLYLFSSSSFTQIRISLCNIINTIKLQIFVYLAFFFLKNIIFMCKKLIIFGPWTWAMRHGSAPLLQRITIFCHFVTSYDCWPFFLVPKKKFWDDKQLLSFRSVGLIANFFLFVREKKVFIVSFDIFIIIKEHKN